MRAPFATAADLARGEGAIDGAAAAWIRDGLRAWLATGGAVPLHRCLELPGSIRAGRLARRDALIAEAAAELSASLGPYQRAGALAAVIAESGHHRAAMRRGRAGQWARGLVIGLLFEAEQFAELPTTTKQLRNILRRTETETESGFGDSLARSEIQT
ncbi:MAG: hypothetical protein LW860_07525 [Xanthomonadaceae bacterium]|jgi:hypothetical protein|nr:hypothetical protein [Xanthomonadaceae bacterium]